LSKGAPNNINGEIICSYKYDVTTTTTTTDSNGNSTTTQTTTTYEDSQKVTFSILTVYTHPGSFNMEATSDSKSNNNIIAKVLTKSKIDDWIAHY
jgi:hypothetical protein